MKQRFIPLEPDYFYSISWWLSYNQLKDEIWTELTHATAIDVESVAVANKSHQRSVFLLNVTISNIDCHMKLFERWIIIFIKLCFTNRNKQSAKHRNKSIPSLEALPRRLDDDDELDVRSRWIMRVRLRERVDRWWYWLMLHLLSAIINAAIDISHHHLSTQSHNEVCAEISWNSMEFGFVKIWLLAQFSQFAFSSGRFDECIIDIIEWIILEVFIYLL